MSGALRTTVLLLMMAVCPVALVACGGSEERDEKNAYVRKVNTAQNEFAANVNTVSQQMTNKSSTSQDRKTLADFETAIEDVVSQLRGIKVPGDVKSEHSQLVTAMGGFGAQIKSANDALRNPTSRNIIEARNAIATATQTITARIQSAINAINSKIKAG